MVTSMERSAKVRRGGPYVLLLLKSFGSNGTFFFLISHPGNNVDDRIEYVRVAVAFRRQGD